MHKHFTKRFFKHTHQKSIFLLSGTEYSAYSIVKLIMCNDNHMLGQPIEHVSYQEQSTPIEKHVQRSSLRMEDTRNRVLMSRSICTGVY